MKSLTSLNANGRSRLDFKEANSIEIFNKKDQLEMIISDNTTLLRRHLKYVFDIDISLSRVHARLTARILLKQLRCFKSFLDFSVRFRTVNVPKYLELEITFDTLIQALSFFNSNLRSKYSIRLEF